MAKVIIAEKPSVAKNIADALKIKSRKDGSFEGNGYYITWAFGHLLQLYDAKDYDENMKGWRFEKFPFIPENFMYKVKCDSMDIPLVISVCFLVNSINHYLLVIPLNLIYILFIYSCKS